MREREGLKIVEEHGEPKIATVILMFYLSEVAGVPGSTTSRCSALARSHWLRGSLEDKTVMKLDGNNTKDSFRQGRLSFSSPQL